MGSGIAKISTLNIFDHATLVGQKKRLTKSREIAIFILYCKGREKEEYGLPLIRESGVC